MWNCCYADYFCMSSGVKQGSVLLVILFTLIVNFAGIRCHRRNYGGIALSSLLSNLFADSIIGNQYESLRSDDLQFAYKSKVSLC